MISFIVSVFLCFSSAFAGSEDEKKPQPLTQQELEDLKKHSQKKLILGLVGAKTLSQSPSGNSWHFDQPSFGLEVGVSEYIALNTSFTFLQQQFVIDKDGAEVVRDRLRGLLPIMFTYRAFPWFYFSAGPYIGFALKEADTYRGSLPPGVKPPASSMDDFLEFGFTTAGQFIVPVTQRIEGFASVYYYAPYNDAVLKKSNSLFFIVGVKLGYK